MEMRRVLFVGLALSVTVQPARAQTRIYVSGDVFAEITQLSKTTAPAILGSGPETSPRDGVTVGGGARIGAFFTPAWSLELGLDLGKTIAEERSVGIRVPLGLTVPSSSLLYQSRTSQRFTATSVLLGYHPPARWRLHPGFRGGVSFMHAERTFTSASVATTQVFNPTVPVFVDPVPTISLATAEYTTLSNGLTATLAAEAAIDLWNHLAIVPEVRAHAGGFGGILVRPGVAARWRW